MAWIGAEKSKTDIEMLKDIARRNSLLVTGQREISIRSSRGWIDFTVLEVAGFVEGMARLIAETFGAAGLESGEHLILGEVSARLWDEAVKIVFPNGHEEVVTIFTFDGFLDIRMPTDKIRGVKPTMVLLGKVYELPLELKDLVEIYNTSEKLIEKIEKAASIYGINRVVSSEALQALRRGSIGEKVEVDYESGYVVISSGKSIRTKPISTYIVELILSGKMDEARRVYEEAPESIKRDVEGILQEEYIIYSSIGNEDIKARLEEFAGKVGIRLESKSQ